MRPLAIPREAKKFGGEKAKCRSSGQEASVAKKIGGHVVPRSGAGMIKGDVRVKGKYRVECKTTVKPGFRVTLEMLNKLDDAGTGAGEESIFVVEFLDEDGKTLRQCAIVDFDYLTTLLPE